MSGLITPSLDEMCHVAAEMERQDFDLPLMIGGATTSRVHTAVKIHPNYRRGQAVYVTDASRAVGVAAALMGRDSRGKYVEELRGEYARIASAHARGQEDKQRLPLVQARRNALKLDWSAIAPRPTFIGSRLIEDFPIAELVDYIDWSPFFSTWELTGKYPAILDDKMVGEAARSLYADARKMLDRIVAEQWFRAGAAVGFWPANSTGDDIEVFGRRFAHRSDRHASHAAPAIVPPRGPRQCGAGRLRRAQGTRRSRRRVRGHRGAGRGRRRRPFQERQRRLFLDHGQGAGRPSGGGLRRAAASSGSAPSSGATPPTRRLSTAELIAEKYRGIRPAPGYPAQPDHTEKGTLFRLLGGERSGVRLTESFAMWPGASVCGLYFGHPESHYFGVGKIERDQVEDYARRKGWSMEEAERWLAPILNYDPKASARVAAA